VLAALTARRSVRKYTEAPVSAGEVRLLLKAAMAAATGHNLQPWHFVVVRDPDVRAALAATHEYSGMICTAPVVIVVCADQGALHWVEDGCLAAGNILTAAAALGLGAVWVAVYPHDEHDMFVRGVLDIPEGIGIVCMVPVGYPAERKAPRTQYDEHKVHFERFGT
jgi:nitroreductase